MTIWLTTDTHLGHSRLGTLGLRPNGFEDRILLNMRTRIVKPSDVLIHLGDVCCGFYGTVLSLAGLGRNGTLSLSSKKGDEHGRNV